jgi:hypothetical protein
MEPVTTAPARLVTVEGRGTVAMPVARGVASSLAACQYVLVANEPEKEAVGWRSTV